MANDEQPQARSVDPLSEITRKERRYLLAVAFVSIVVAKAGLVPKEISNLGITFSDVDRSILLKAAAVMVAYFMAAFVIYGVSDFFAWRLARHRLIESTRSRTLSIAELQRVTSVFRGSAVRAVFDFMLPVATGLYAIYVLWRAW